MSDSKFSIKIEETLSCGHPLVEIAHMKADKDFLFSLKGAELESLYEVINRPFSLPDIPEILITLQGHCEKLEITGIELKDHAFRCVVCGADAMFIGGH